MKVVINKTEHAIYADGTLLVPGTNLVDKFDESDAAAKSFIEGDQISVGDSSKMDDKAKKEAVKNANTRDVVKGLKKTFKGIDTTEADEKLDKFEDQLKKAQ